jgi:hypothetical protein
MTRTQGEIAKAKLKMLEIYQVRPKISDAEMGRMVKLDAHTVAKYKKDIIATLTGITVDVERQLTAKVAEKEGIWQKLIKALK